MIHLRKYGVATRVPFVLYEPDGVKMHVGPTFTIGDLKISKDDSAIVNMTNLPINTGAPVHSLDLTAAEMIGKNITVAIRDVSTTQVWLDKDLNIVTYGDFLGQINFNSGLLNSGHIASVVVANTQFSLSNGSTDNEAYVGGIIIIDLSTTIATQQRVVGRVTSYDGGLGTITVAGISSIPLVSVGSIFEIYASDKMALQYTDARAAGLDNIIGHTPQTADHTASVAAILADTADIQPKLGAPVTTIAGDIATTQPSGPVDLNANQVGVTIGTVTTLAGHTPQTGDSFALIGTPVAADISADVANVQSSVNNIGAGSSGGLEFEVLGDNVLAPLKGVTFIGAQTAGTFVNTQINALDYHNITSDGPGNIDIVYRFNVGGNRQSINALFQGFLNINNRLANFFLYNFDLAVWEIQPSFTLAGINGSTNTVEPIINALARNTGSGLELGDFYVRIKATAQLNSDLFVGTLFATGVDAIASAGYGNTITIDTTGSGTPGSNPRINGTIDNPVDNIADLDLLIASKNFDTVTVRGSSTITLTTSSSGLDYHGHAYTVALNGQSIIGATFTGAFISGIGTGGGNLPQFNRCRFQTSTLPPTMARECGFLPGITITAGEGGAYTFFEGHNMDSFTNSMIFDFNKVVNTITAVKLNLKPCSGGYTVTNMKAADELSMDGFGQLIIDASNTVGGSIRVSALVTVVDNVVGGFTGTIVKGDLNTLIGTPVVDIATDIARVNSEVKYAGKITFSDITGTAGTDPNLNGTYDNPVNNMADLDVLMAAKGTNKAFFLQESPIALTANSNGKQYDGFAYEIDLNAKDIAGMTISNALVLGTANPLSGPISESQYPRFINCTVVNGISVPSSVFINCNIRGGITAVSLSFILFQNCSSSVFGFFINFNGAFTPGTVVELYDCSGDYTLIDMDSTSGFVFEGFGSVTIDPTCLGGSIKVSSDISIIDNVVGGFTGTIIKGDITNSLDSLIDLSGATADITAASSGTSFTISNVKDAQGAAITLATDMFAGQVIKATTRPAQSTRSNVIDQVVMIQSVTSGGVVTVKVDDIAGAGFSVTPNTTTTSVRIL